MAEKGRVWSERETRAFIEIWSEREIQQQLCAAVRNDVVFSKIAADLVKCGYQRTVAQCRGKSLQTSSQCYPPPLPVGTRMCLPPHRCKLHEHDHDLHRGSHLSSHLIDKQTRMT